MSDPDPKKKRKVIHSEGREMIARVYHFLQQEYKLMKKNNINCDLTPLVHVRKRTAEATGVSERLVSQILREERELLLTGGKFPMKNRRNRSSKYDLSNMDLDTIRITIENYHSQHKETPSLGKLLSVLREKIGFDGSKTTLRSLLKKMGYKWRNVTPGQRKMDILKAENKT